MTPFDAYVKYVAIKKHFTQSSYSFFKYNGKLKLKQSSFDVRSDKYFFEKLAKKKDVIGFLVANFIENPNAWIRDLVTGSDAEDVYIAWCKRVESLTYNFTNEISIIDDLDDWLKVSNGNYPKLLVAFNRGKVSRETLILLNDLLDFFPRWEKRIQDSIAWPNTLNLLNKYSGFVHHLNYNKLKLKEVLLAHLTDK